MLQTVLIIYLVVGVIYSVLFNIALIMAPEETINQQVKESLEIFNKEFTPENKRNLIIIISIISIIIYPLILYKSGDERR